MTLLDVARHCGVSKATVSRILNDRRGKVRFRPETRQRVIEAANALAYRPSHRARTFARRRSEAIGILYGSDLPPLGELYKGFFDVLLREAQAHAYHVVFIPARYAIEDWDRLAWHERVDGFVAVESIPAQCRAHVEGVKLPLVVCNAEASPDHDTIVFDDYDGARQATQHLLALGHRRIHCWLLRSDHYSVRERRRAFIETMVNAGATSPEESVVETDDDQIEQFVDRCLAADPRPTALIIYSHFKAVEVLQMLHARSLQVPHDMSVVTFNDVFPASFVVPPLTTVHLPFEQMGRRAAAMIFEKIEQGNSKRERIVLPVSLVIRGSTAPESDTGMPTIKQESRV